MGSVPLSVGMQSLEGSTERSESNRGRSLRVKSSATQIWLEASTMFVRVLPSRQVIESRIDNPETSSPVTNNSLCSLC